MQIRAKFTWESLQGFPPSTPTRKESVMQSWAISAAGGSWPFDFPTRPSSETAQEGKNTANIPRLSCRCGCGCGAYRCSKVQPVLLTDQIKQLYVAKRSKITMNTRKRQQWAKYNMVTHFNNIKTSFLIHECKFMYVQFIGVKIFGGRFRS